MIPNPWIILGFVGVLLASTVGGYFYGGHVTKLSYELVLANQKTEAATILSNATAINAAINEASYLNARKLDERHDQDIAAIDASAGDFDKRLRLAVSRKSCSSSVPVTPGHSNIPQDITTGSNGGSRSVNIDAGNRLREVGLKLQATVRECVIWAAIAGR